VTIGMCKLHKRLFFALVLATGLTPPTLLPRQPWPLSILPPLILWPIARPARGLRGYYTKRLGEKDQPPTHPGHTLLPDRRNGNESA
jgi:hypothetical protein